MSTLAFPSTQPSNLHCELWKDIGTQYSKVLLIMSHSTMIQMIVWETDLADHMWADGRKGHNTIYMCSIKSVSNYGGNTKTTWYRFLVWFQALFSPLPPSFGPHQGVPGSEGIDPNHCPLHKKAPPHADSLQTSILLSHFQQSLSLPAKYKLSNEYKVIPN